MPFRKIKIKDKDNKDVLDAEGNPTYKDEEFLPFFLGNTKEEADQIYKRYITTLSALANKYATYNNVEETDLIQEGTIGLARAVRDFDKERSKDFTIFAIYKIKDAMREFVSKQASDIRIPQYIKEATRLVSKLLKLLDKVNSTKERDFISIWEESKVYDDESEIIKDINLLRDSLSNLADRAGTTVGQLLERAELYPAEMTDVDGVYNVGDIANMSFESVEDTIVDQLMAEKSINKLKSLISEDDFNLLYAHYVNGMTVRDLEPIIGIRAASITVKIHNILDSLQSKKEHIIMS